MTNVYSFYLQKPPKGEKTLTHTLTILGKRRKLIGEFGNYFLDNPKDVLAVGIFCGLPLHLWRDEKYLNRIRARKEQNP